jgi:hypothetical protein
MHKSIVARQHHVPIGYAVQCLVYLHKIAISICLSHLRSSVFRQEPAALVSVRRTWHLFRQFSPPGIKISRRGLLAAEEPKAQIWHRPDAHKLQGRYASPVSHRARRRVASRRTRPDSSIRDISRRKLGAMALRKTGYRKLPSCSRATTCLGQLPARALSCILMPMCRVSRRSRRRRRRGARPPALDGEAVAIRGVKR